MSDKPSEFYDADYYEYGRVSGKSWLMNYRWMPRRSFREALAFIDALGLDETSRVLDFGCAKGFLVTAMNHLDIYTEGCDISEYALGFANKNLCWNCSELSEWSKRSGKYTHIIAKDVFEHIAEEDIVCVLERLGCLADKMMCVIPMGDNGIYRIPEYHMDKSHVIAQNELWWIHKFEEAGWELVETNTHVKGLKDNWAQYNGGNMVFILRRKK